MPECQLRWMLSVKKGYTSLTEKQTGVEVIKALRVSETVEIAVGPMKVGEYHSISVSSYSTSKEYKDKMDYEIIIAQGDQELLRVGSDANFAKSTKPITPVAGGVPVPIRALPKIPGDEFGIGDLEKPKPIVAEVKPAELKPLIGKEDMPPVSITPTPSVVIPPPQKEYSLAKPFDFFNLGGNRK